MRPHHTHDSAGHHPEGHRPRGRGRRRRGDVRGLILAALLDGPGHGYELMARLEEKSSGAWRPSAGSVYPTLQQLEDEGLIRGADAEGRRVFELTDAGREHADPSALERLAEGGRGRGGPNGPELWHEVKQLTLAARQVGSVGTPEQVETATAVVRDARKALYQLLADD